jgi:hypothetical protein
MPHADSRAASPLPRAHKGLAATPDPYQPEEEPLTIVLSGHDLCRTRDCQFPGCTDDAEPGTDRCTVHAGVNATMAVTNDALLARRAAVIDWITMQQNRLGHPPNTREFPLLDPPFGFKDVRSLFGNWGNAVEAAGYVRGRRGVKQVIA